MWLLLEYWDLAVIEVTAQYKDTFLLVASSLLGPSISGCNREVIAQYKDTFLLEASSLLGPPLVAVIERWPL